MTTLNKAILIGRLGKDPETRFTQAGKQITTFSIATAEKNAEKETKTTWHNIVAFDRLAEVCATYLTKGSLVYVEGRIVNDEYEKDGVKKITTKIHAKEMKMLGGGKKKETENNTEDVPF